MTEHCGMDLSAPNSLDLPSTLILDSDEEITQDSTMLTSVINGSLAERFAMIEDSQPQRLTPETRNDLIISLTQQPWFPEMMKFVYTIGQVQERSNVGCVPDHSFLHAGINDALRRTLAKCIRRVGDITSMLFGAGKLNDREMESITCLKRNGTYSMADSLLNVLGRKELNSYYCFLHALDKTGQGHLRKLLENPGYHPQFLQDIRHRSLLKKMWVPLKADIKITGTRLLDFLLQYDVLDDNEIEIVKFQRSESESVEELLCLIRRSSKEQYDLFMKALLNGENEHVYDYLTEAGKKHDDRVTLSLLPSRPTTVLHVIQNNGPIHGISVMGSELFVVRAGSSRMFVYDTNNFHVIQNPTIYCSKNLWGIVACALDRCVYLSDPVLNIIFQYNLSSKSITRMWLATGGCRSLALTKNNNIIAVLSEARRIAEYTRDGCLIRYMLFNIQGGSPEEPRHCVQMSNNSFVVSCFGQVNARVVTIDTVVTTDADTNDTTVGWMKSYGGTKGSGLGQMGGPYNMSVDKHDNILVTDFFNNRLELLSSDLTHRGYLLIPGHQLNGPHAVYIDELARRIYIGEYDGGRIFVLASKTDVDSNRDIGDMQMQM